jgi:hypothetical protein
MTSTTESSISLAPTRAAAAPATPPAPAPVGLWMLTILIGAFFVLVGVCFWMGTQIR